MVVIGGERIALRRRRAQQPRGAARLPRSPHPSHRAAVLSAGHASRARAPTIRAPPRCRPYFQHLRYSLHARACALSHAFLRSALDTPPTTPPAPSPPLPHLFSVRALPAFRRSLTLTPPPPLSPTPFQLLSHSTPPLSLPPPSHPHHTPLPSTTSTPLFPSPTTPSNPPPHPPPHLHPPPPSFHLHPILTHPPPPPLPPPPYTPPSPPPPFPSLTLISSPPPPTLLHSLTPLTLSPTPLHSLTLTHPPLSHLSSPHLSTLSFSTYTLLSFRHGGYALSKMHSRQAPRRGNAPNRRCRSS